MPHGWHHYARIIPEGRRAIERIGVIRAGQMQLKTTKPLWPPARRNRLGRSAPRACSFTAATATTSLIAFRALSKPDKLTALHYQTSASRDTMSSCYLRRLSRSGINVTVCRLKICAAAPAAWRC
jgi:hypothetical protein